MKKSTRTHRSVVLLSSVLVATTATLSSPAFAGPPKKKGRSVRKVVKTENFAPKLLFTQGASGLTYKLRPDNLGLEVTGTDFGSPAREAGLQPGDVITHVHRAGVNIRVRMGGDFDAAMAGLRGTVWMWGRDVNNLQYQWIKVVLAGPVLPPPPPAINLSGVWNSNLGRVTLFQNGNQVTGTLDILFGGTSQINGNLNGNTLQFSWNSDVPAGSGTGTLTLSPNGNRLSGNFVNQIGNNGGVWTMTR